MKVIECSWCDNGAKFASEGVAYCTWHMIFLYLSLIATADADLEN